MCGRYCTIYALLRADQCLLRIEILYSTLYTTQTFIVAVIHDMVVIHIKASTTRAVLQACIAQVTNIV